MTGKVLAFDTSNYTTSVAAADLAGNILADERQLLSVKEGDRGLRQSHALFQHVETLPQLVERVMKQIGTGDFCAVAVSDRPRPLEGSYMPVFRAGVDFARTAAAVLGVPIYRFSHQEGHIAAVCGALQDDVKTVSFHMSGGTGEILVTRGCRPEKIVGGIRDLSFGQLIDRVGVALGHSFPAGATLDRIACGEIPEGGFSYSSRGNTKIDDPMTGTIHTEGAYANLSGIETQLMRDIEKRKLGKEAASALGDVTEDPAAESFQNYEKKIAAELFCRIADALVKISQCAMKEAKTDTIVFVGGVSSSAFLRSELTHRLEGAGYHAVFGEPRLSSDNACGIARLGASAYVREFKKY